MKNRRNQVILSLKVQRQFKQKNSFWFRFSSNLFKLICCLGFIVQSFHVLKRYFSYDTSTIINVEKPAVSVLPDLALCFPVVTLINYTQLFKSYPQLTTKLGITPSTLLLDRFQLISHLVKRFSRTRLFFLLARDLTIKQVTENFIPASELFLSVDILEKKGRPIIELCHLKTVYRSMTYCYILSCNLNGRVNKSDHDHYQSLVNVELFQLHIKYEYLKIAGYFYMTLIFPGSLPAGRTLKWESELSMEGPLLYWFNFDILQVKQLPAPYPSDCFDYTALSSSYTSLEMVQDECLINQSIKLMDKPFPGSLVYPDWNYQFPFIVWEDNLKNDTYYQLIYQILDYCFTKFYRAPCFSQTYGWIQRSPVRLHGDESIVLIDEIREPSIYIHHRPKMSALDCIIQIGSILGTWFGFSVYVDIPSILRAFYQFSINYFTSCNVGSKKRNIGQRKKSFLTNYHRKTPK